MNTSRAKIGVVLLAAAAATASSIVTFAQGRTAGSPDISGYWELPLDGRHVPPARLAPRVTPAMLQAEAAKNAK